MILKDIELIPHAKYLEEEYTITFNFATRLKAGQSLSSVVVTAEDVHRKDVTAQIVGNSDATSPIVTVLLKENGGERGQLYYVRSVATTNEGRKLEVVLELEIK